MTATDATRYDRERMRKTESETAILAALVPLLEGRYGRLRFDHHPDEVIPADRQKRRAPDALYVGESGAEVMVEVTELARKEPLQYSRAKAQRAEAVGDVSLNFYPIDSTEATVKAAVINCLMEAEEKFQYRPSAWAFSHSTQPPMYGGRCCFET